MTNSTPLKITITAQKAGDRGHPYSVSFEGKTIIAKSHVASHDACRHLAAIGFSGPLEVWADGEPFPRLRISDIGKAAKWTVSENASTSARFVCYVPFTDSRMYQQVHGTASAA